MSEQNGNDAGTPCGGDACRAKRAAGSLRARLKGLLKPEILKPAAVCFFMLFLLWCECAAFFFSKAEVHSILRPFIKGMGLYLAIFGLSIIPGGRTTKILLTFWLALMGVVAAVGIFLYLRFALDMNSDCFFVLAVSSKAETKEFLDRFLTWKLALALCAAAAVCGGMIAFVWRTKFKRSRLNTAVSLLLVLPFVLQSAIYLAVEKVPELIYSQSNLPRAAFGYFAYRKKLSRLMKLEKAPRLPSGIKPLAGSEKLVGVLAIGESANCNHWGAYGYPRNTTPQIGKRADNCIVYDDAVAAAAWTGGAIYRMFTDATVSRWRVRFTFIDVLKAAGWRVVLISNHNRWGRKDGPIGILTAHCDRRIYMQDIMKDPFDGDMLPVLEEELRNASGGRLLVVVHLIGSHNNFSARYPRNFARFDGVRDQCNSGMIDEHAKELNEYDNSIAYTDSVLGGILERLEKLTGPAFMIYCSDHSETGGWSGYRYARSAATAIPDIYEIPFVFWTNEEYRRAFPQFVADAAGNRHAPIQTDRLIWSIISAAQVTFDEFPYEKDIFSGGRYRPPEVRWMKYKTPYRPSAAKRKLREKRGPEKNEQHETVNKNRSKQQGDDHGP